MQVTRRHVSMRQGATHEKCITASSRHDRCSALPRQTSDMEATSKRHPPFSHSNPSPTNGSDDMQASKRETKMRIGSAGNACTG
eukprot:3328380-Alexandrium_andersonii.AAC.1